MSITTASPPSAAPADRPDPVRPRPWSGLVRRRRVRTPTRLQMEATECGAAALGIVLAHFGHWAPLEELRVACGVSRDGSRASNVVQAARQYGLVASGYRAEPADLRDMPLPLIVFWQFNHFLVVEGFGRNTVYLNDPVLGPRVVTAEEFDEGFTGVVLTCQPGPAFRPNRAKPSLLAALSRRLGRSAPAVTYLLLAGLGLVALGLLTPAFTRVFVDRILVGGQDGIALLLTVMALAAGLCALLTALQQHCLLRLESRLAVSMSSPFLWHVLRLPIQFFAQRYAGEIGARVSINDRVARLLAGDLAGTGLDLLVIGFYAALMLQYDVLLTGLGVATALLNLLALRWMARRRVDVSQRLLMDRTKLLTATVGGMQTIETIKATGRESDFFTRWAGYHARVVNSQQRASLVTQSAAVLPTLLAGLNAAAILTLGGFRVMEGALTLGMLVAFQALMASFLAPVTRLVSLGGTLQDVEGDLSRLDDVLHAQVEPSLSPRVSGKAANGVDSQQPVRLDGYLELCDVTFGYSQLDPPLVDGLNLTLRPGERVALVGRSGSGKSTVAKLVSGLYEPWAGQIWFDGRPRAAIPRSTLTGSIALVDQQIAMFEGTVRDNLTLWDASVPESAIVQAARDAAIHDEIVARQHGYEHVVEEGGVTSAGASSSALRSPVRSPATRPCWCSTRRRARSIH